MNSKKMLVYSLRIVLLSFTVPYTNSKMIFLTRNYFSNAYTDANDVQNLPRWVSPQSQLIQLKHCCHHQHMDLPFLKPNE